MMRMKMIMAVALIVIVVFGFAGCGETERGAVAGSKPLTPQEREAAKAAIGKKVKAFFEPVAKIEEAEQYYKSERFEEAEQLYLSVIETRPSRPLFTTRAYVGLAEVYVAMGKPKEAQEAAEKAVELGELVSGEYWTLGECYEKLGDPTKAEEAYLKAIELQPEASLYTLLGQFYGKHGQDSKAEAAFKRGLELDPANCSSHLLMATYYGRAKRYTDEIAAYENAIKYCDSNERKVKILNNMGAVYKMMQKLDKSAEAYEKALSLATHPDHVGMTCRNMASLALWFVVSDNLGEALRLCDIALKNNPQNVQALRNKAYVLSGRGQYAAAHELLDQALRISPDNPMVFIGFAHVYSDEGKNGKALQAAERAVEVSSGKYLWSESTLGEVYVRTKQYQKAVELLEPLVKENSNHADLCFWYGQALVHSDRPEEGLKFVERAASKLPLVVEYKQGLQALQKQ